MPKLNEAQVTKAVKALAAINEYKRLEGEKAGGVRALFEEDEDIFLMFALHRTPTDTRTKPYQIPLVHTLYGQDGQEVCLITKDPVKPFKSYVEDNPIPGLTKVIGFTQLKRNYNQYKLKRELLASYDLFVADDRILPLLPPVLGKGFFQRKKQPYPVVLKGKNWAPQIIRARDSTYFFLTTGPSTSVRVARSSFPVAHTVENVMGSVDHIVDKIPRKWNNIQAIYLKTSKSAALPIYTSLPQQTKIATASESAYADAKKSKKRGPARVKSTIDADENEQTAIAAPSAKKRKTTAKPAGKKKENKGFGQEKARWQEKVY